MLLSFALVLYDKRIDVLFELVLYDKHIDVLS